MKSKQSPTISSEDHDKLDRLRSQLDDLCSDLAAKFNLYDSKGRPRKAFIIDTLMKYSCNGCIVKTFTQQYENKVEVDAIYKENHRLATSLLTQYLQYRLNEEGFNILVQDEVEGDYGRADVLVKPIACGVLLKLKTKEVLIEIKTGRTLSYNQIFRYLIEKPSATLLVWRILARQILVISRETTIQLLLTYLEITIRRGKLLLGREMKPCSHNYEEKPYTIKNPQQVIDDFASALTETIPRMVDAVLHVLFTNK